MAKHNLLTKEQIDEIILAYDICRNQQKVCEITQHSSSTVSKYLIANGRGCGQGGNQNYVITDEQILKGIAEGLSRQEIADKYGTHVENLAKRMKKLGVHAVYVKPKYSKPANAVWFGAYWHYIKSHDDLAKEKHPDFVYLESRKKGNTITVRLKCKKCNTVIERSSSTFRCKSIRCDYCTEKQKQQIELQNERVKLMRFFVALKEYKTPKICKGCGSEYYSQFENSVYCSHKCRNKNRKSGSGIRSRCHHYGVYYDPAVKPKLIFKRDHYICQICGMATNPDDRSWNGHFGPYSPTVDHIVALANGGPHTWDNVQCAHAKCNSWKRDLLTV